MENEIGVMGSKLWAALAKAQGQIQGAHKSSDNPFFKSKFADLAECIYVSQKPAADNGLSLVFDFKTEIVDNNPVFWIRYILSHSSGETFTSHWIIMLMSKKDAHGFGGANTYYRRQLMKSVYNIPEIDSDGNDLVHNDPPAPRFNTNVSQNKPPVRVPVTK